VKGGAFIDFSIGPHSSAVLRTIRWTMAIQPLFLRNPSSSAVSERPEQFVTILHIETSAVVFHVICVSPCFADAQPTSIELSSPAW